jgi:dTDP-4-dehydrorhamnose 3,5-epimerase
MQFRSTPLPKVTIVELDPFEDERGFFARAFSAPEFEEQGLTGRVVQTNISYNRRAGTVRGLHYQTGEAAEAKLIRCVAGEAFMAVVDLRPGPTRLQHTTAVLNRDNRHALFVPEGCAVGLQAQRDDTELIYQVSQYYTPDAEGGLRYDDPALGIRWPLEMTVISDKDAAWPYFQP